MTVVLIYKQLLKWHVYPALNFEEINGYFFFLFLSVSIIGSRLFTHKIFISEKPRDETLSDGLYKQHFYDLFKTNINGFKRIAF